MDVFRFGNGPRGKKVCHPPAPPSGPSFITSFRHQGGPTLMQLGRINLTLRSERECLLVLCPSGPIQTLTGQQMTCDKRVLPATKPASNTLRHVGTFPSAVEAPPRSIPSPPRIHLGLRALNCLDLTSSLLCAASCRDFPLAVCVALCHNDLVCP